MSRKNARKPKAYTTKSWNCIGCHYTVSLWKLFEKYKSRERKKEKNNKNKWNGKICGILFVCAFSHWKLRQIGINGLHSTLEKSDSKAIDWPEKKWQNRIKKSVFSKQTKDKGKKKITHEQIDFPWEKLNFRRKWKAKRDEIEKWERKTAKESIKLI